MNIDPTKLYTPREAAKILRVHHRTVLNWIEEGQLSASRPIHKYLIRFVDIQTLLERSKVEAW